MPVKLQKQIDISLYFPVQQAGVFQHFYRNLFLKILPAVHTGFMAKTIRILAQNHMVCHKIRRSLYKS